MALRFVKLLFLAFGFCILLLAINETDLEEVFLQASKIGWFGLCIVLILYSFAFLLDSITWAITIVNLPLNIQWIVRTLAVRLIGEAFNNTVPAGGVGGEPIKAFLLKFHYGIKYREGMASLVLAKTINMISLCIFLLLGFLMMVNSHKLSLDAKQLSLVGLIVVLGATGLLYFVQKIKFVSATGSFLSRFSITHKLTILVRYLKDFDERLISFYDNHRKRLCWATILALSNWLLGVLEVYYAMLFLGRPVTLGEAYMIEAVAQMVRMGTFFIPMSLGAQEGAFLIIIKSLTGSGSLGLAIAIVRRVREIIWIILGFSVGLKYSLRRGKK